MSAFKMRWSIWCYHTEVIGIKFEETGTIEYVVPDRNYAKDDFVVVLEKKDTRLAQVVMETLIS